MSFKLSFSPLGEVNIPLAEIGSFLSLVFSYLKSPVVNVVTLCCQSDKLEDKMDSLLRLKEEVEAGYSLLGILPDRDGRPIGSVEDRCREWLTEVENLVDEVSKARDLGSTRRARLLHRELSLYGTGENLVNSLPRPDPARLEYVRVPWTEVRVASDDPRYEAVRQQLHAPNVAVVGVYGPAWIGKTAVLRELYNQLWRPAIDNPFTVVIWVAVSREPDLGEIRNAICRTLGFSLSDYPDRDPADTLHAVLSRRSFLLLLDDVWATLDLRELGVSARTPGSRSKVVFATQFRQNCQGFGADVGWAEMKALTPEKSQGLFWTAINDPELEVRVRSNNPWLTITNKMIRQCDGIPVAVVSLAQRMASAAKDYGCWQRAYTEQLRAQGGVTAEETVRTILKPKFDVLNEKERERVMYFSLFPSDYAIDEQQLVDYWVGEGLADIESDEEDDIVSLRCSCRNFIAKLEGHFWLIQSRGNLGWKKVRLPTHLHQCAVRLNQDDDPTSTNKIKFLEYAAKGMTSVREHVLQKWKIAERVSLMHNNISSLQVPEHCPDLKTLFLNKNPLKFVGDAITDRASSSSSSPPPPPASSLVSSSFFQSMREIRVLDLSSTSVEALPSDVKLLTMLKYLNLSHTRIRSLPRELKYLVKLRQLDLSYTEQLSGIPSTEMSELKGLLILNLYDSAYLLSANDSQSEQYWWDWLLQRRELGVSIKIDLPINIPSECDCPSIKFLKLEGTRDSTFTTGELSFIDHQFEQLEILKLKNIPLSQAVVPSGHLQMLCCLYVEGCHELQNIGWVQQLPNLEEIHITDCKGMKNLLSEVSGGSMNTLREIQLRKLPNLQTIYSRSCFLLGRRRNTECRFPNLENFEGVGCLKLKKPYFEKEDAPKLNLNPFR